jgi:hypothetical protein
MGLRDMGDKITSSIVVNFANNIGDDETILNAEVDNRKNGLNKGKSSFHPGDSVGFLLYPGANVHVDSVLATAGQVSALGAQRVLIEERITFTDSDVASVAQPVLALGGYKWLGNSGGAIALSGERTIKAAQPVLGVLLVLYQARAFGYRLAGVPHPLNGAYEYPVMITANASVA